MPYQPEIVVTPTQQYPQVEFQRQGYPYTTWGQIPGAPYITVSSKGIVNGLSVLPNDGGGFGPDTKLGATSPSQYGPPYTQSTGIGEAIQYAINNPIMYNSDVSGYWIPEVRLTGGYLTITKPIVLNVPHRIMNLTLKGVDTMSPYIGCAFNTTSSDEYPYAININSSDLSNITYIAIQWEHFQSQATSGYTPYGFANFDFSSVNTDQNGFIGFDLNVSNNGFVNAAFNLLGFQQIRMYDFEDYGSPCYFNGQDMGFYGGYGGPIYVSGGQVLSLSGGEITPNGDIDYVALFGRSAVNIGEYNANQTFTIGTLFYGYGPGLGSFNRSLYIEPSSGTITINQVIIRDITASGLTSDTPLTGSQGATLNVGVWDIEGVYSENTYIWTGIPYNAPSTPSVPASGTAQQNTNPYPVNVYIYGGDVTEIQITRNGTVYTVLSVSTAIAMSGQVYKLNREDSITITYSTAPSWEWLSD